MKHGKERQNASKPLIGKEAGGHTALVSAHGSRGDQRHNRSIGGRV